MIHNQQIERVESCKYLGVFIDYNMKWDKHIEYRVYGKSNKVPNIYFCKNKKNNGHTYSNENILCPFS